MGAIGGDELMEYWEKMEGGADVGDGGGGGRLEKILVSVRLRPLSAKEISANDPADWECINDTTIIFRNSLGDRSMAPTAYNFGERPSSIDFVLWLDIYNCYLVN